MEEQKAKPFLCPFCGAPQRKLIPPNTVQVRCQYCGATILVPPWTSGGTSRCPNHHGRSAVAICNDCGESFCWECLHIYHLKADGATAVLYLCPICLRRRHIKRADAAIYLGIFFLLFGTFSALFYLPWGIFLIIAGVVSIIYGVSKRVETPKELTLDELRVEKEKRKVELARAPAEDIDPEKTYNELMKPYINRWGATTGISVLKNDIMAYTRHGVSFPEALKKIYMRRKSKKDKNTHAD